MTYTLLLLGILVLGLLIDSPKKRHPILCKRIFLFTSFFAAACVMGFRGMSVGMDTPTYAWYFQEISKTRLLSLLSTDSFNGTLETGFALLMKLCSYVVNDYFFFQILFSLAYCGLCCLFIYRNARNYRLATVCLLAVGLYLYAFNVQRQMWAVMLCASGWYYLLRGMKLQPLLLFLLAYSAHHSAAVFVAAYVLYMVRNNRKLLLFAAAGIVFFVFRSDLLWSFAQNSVEEYDLYYNNNRDIQTGGLVYYLWTIEACLCLYVLLRRKQFTSQDRLIALLSGIYLAANVIGISFNYFERIGYYFLPFVPLLFDCVGTSLPGKKLRLTYFLIAGICFGIYFIKAGSTAQYAYVTFL